MKGDPVRPKKSLGQNFLVDQNIARKIVAALDLQPNDRVVEIGPGCGALTQFLVPQVADYVGIELDRNLVPRLQTEFGQAPGFHLIEDDFLKIDFQTLLLGVKNNKIVGNIPYHITSGVIFKVIEQRQFFQQMTLMIQLEVAERIVASPGSKLFGILSVLSQTFSVPKLLFTVSPNVFFPRPKVTSAVVQWDFSRPARYPAFDETGFMRLIKNVFQFRRKMLRKSLRHFYGEILDFTTAGIDLSRRPESLEIAEFLSLWEIISRTNSQS